MKGIKRKEGAGKESENVDKAKEQRRERKGYELKGIIENREER